VSIEGELGGEAIGEGVAVKAVAIAAAGIGATVGDEGAASSRGVDAVDRGVVGLLAGGGDAVGVGSGLGGVSLNKEKY